MDFSTECNVSYQIKNTKESDKRNYYSESCSKSQNISNKTQRYMVFFQGTDDYNDEYSYGDTLWK